MREENLHAGGKWETMNFLGVALASRLAYRLSNVVRQAGRQTKNLVLAIFFKNPYLSFYSCCIVLCTISGFSNVKAV